MPRASPRARKRRCKLLAKAFEKLGVTEINPLGEPFDPGTHEAMLAQPSARARAQLGAAGRAAGYEL